MVLPWKFPPYTVHTLTIGFTSFTARFKGRSSDTKKKLVYLHFFVLVISPKTSSSFVVTLSQTGICQAILLWTGNITCHIRLPTVCIPFGFLLVGSPIEIGRCRGCSLPRTGRNHHTTQSAVSIFHGNLPWNRHGNEKGNTNGDIVDVSHFVCETRFPQLGDLV